MDKKSSLGTSRFLAVKSVWGEPVLQVGPHSHHSVPLQGKGRVEKIWSERYTVSTGKTLDCPVFWRIYLGELGSVVGRPADSTTIRRCTELSQNTYMGSVVKRKSWPFNISKLLFLKVPTRLDKCFFTISTTDFLNSDQVGGGGLWWLKGGERRTRVSGRGKGSCQAGRPASKSNDS